MTTTGMDNVELCLLTTTRHHEQLAEFEAASQADPAQQVVGPGDASQPATQHAAEEGPYKAKKRPKKSKNESLELEDAIEDGESEEEFRVPNPPSKKKGKKNK